MTTDYLFRCVVCGKLTKGGRLPNAGWGRKGDGTFRYPRRHKQLDGERCKGSFIDADWVDAATGQIMFASGEMPNHG